MTAAILNYDALHPWIEMVLVCWLCVAVVQQVLAYLRNKEAELDLRDKHKDLPPCDCGSGHNIWDCTCEVDWRDEDIERERRAGIWDDIKLTREDHIEANDSADRRQIWDD